MTVWPGHELSGGLTCSADMGVHTQCTVYETPDFHPGTSVHGPLESSGLHDIVTSILIVTIDCIKHGHSLHDVSEELF